MTEAGHNGVNSGELRAFVERIEAVEAEIRERNEDKSSIYSEARGSGYDAKILKQVIGIRRTDREKRREEKAVLGLYLSALGIEE